MTSGDPYIEWGGLIAMADNAKSPVGTIAIALGCISAARNPGRKPSCATIHKRYLRGELGSDPRAYPFVLVSFD